MYPDHASVQIGGRFGRWVVLRTAEPNKGNQKRFWCRCDCGVEKPVTSLLMRNGGSKSCGCLRNEMFRAQNVIHGGSRTSGKTPEYRAWIAMRARCRDKAGRNAKSYMDRGITVCERWNDFRLFLADMGLRPGDEYSVERRDNDKGYAPENCYWLPRSFQNKNTRRTRLLAIGDRTLNMSEWARVSGTSDSTISRRLRNGVPPMVAVFGVAV